MSSAERSCVPASSDLLDRIREEYRQMPGLRLTLGQAGRLFGLDGSSCGRALAELREEGFLRCTSGGMFVVRPERISVRPAADSSRRPVPVARVETPVVQ